MPKQNQGLMVPHSPGQEAIPVPPREPAAGTAPYRQGERRTPGLTPASDAAAITVSSSMVPSFIPCHLLYFSLGLLSILQKNSPISCFFLKTMCADLNEGGKQLKTQNWNSAKYYRVQSNWMFSSSCKNYYFCIFDGFINTTKYSQLKQQIVLRGMLFQHKIENVYRKEAPLSKKRFDENPGFFWAYTCTL